MEGSAFLLVVITAPADVPRETELLEGLLENGLERLHLRKRDGEVEGLLDRLAPRWASRLVVHGSGELALRYGVAQVHGAVKMEDGGDSGGGKPPGGGVRRSTSVHSWEELMRLPDGLEYSFISPVFDSISKPGYRAGRGILKMPPGPYPCRPVGLGGVSAETVGSMVECGWKGAALLGTIWEAPGEAVTRFRHIKKIVDG